LSRPSALLVDVTTVLAKNSGVFSHGRRR
jgi:hypothetical protein